MDKMKQEFDKIVEALARSTCSPRGKYSKEESWLKLEGQIPSGHKNRFFISTWKVAASIAVLCVLSWGAYHLFSSVQLQTTSTFAETCTIILPDESKVMLNRYSSLTYPKKFKGNERKVKLKGEAYFEVAKNENKTFKVEAGDVCVEVLGTHFNVKSYEREDFVKTTLLESSVSLQTSKVNGAPIILSPGESATYCKQQENFVVKTEVNVLSCIQWRNEILSFENLSLKEIAEELSIFFNTEIIIQENSLKNYRMTATFSSQNSLEEILTLLSRNQLFTFNMEDSRVVISLK